MKGSRDEYPLSAGILSRSPLTCSSTPPILRVASQSTLTYLNFEKYTPVATVNNRSIFATSAVTLRTVAKRGSSRTQNSPNPFPYRTRAPIVLFSTIDIVGKEATVCVHGS